MKYLLIIILFTFSCAWQGLIKKHPSGSLLYTCTLKKGNPIPIVLAADVPLEDIPLITHSISIWNKALGTEVFIYSGMANWRTNEMPEPENYIWIGITPPLKEEENLGYFLGIRNDRDKCYKAGKIIYIPEMIGLNPLRKIRVITHELGHALCANHSEKIGTLMFPMIPLEMGCSSNSLSCIPLPSEKLVNKLKELYNLK